METGRCSGARRTSTESREQAHQEQREPQFGNGLHEGKKQAGGRNARTGSGLSAGWKKIKLHWDRASNCEKRNGRLEQWTSQQRIQSTGEKIQIHEVTHHRGTHQAAENARAEIPGETTTLITTRWNLAGESDDSKQDWRAGAWPGAWTQNSERKGENQLGNTRPSCVYRLPPDRASPPRTSWRHLSREQRPGAALRLEQEGAPAPALKKTMREENGPNQPKENHRTERAQWKSANALGRTSETIQYLKENQQLEPQSDRAAIVIRALGLTGGNILPGFHQMQLKNEIRQDQKGSAKIWIWLLQKLRPDNEKQTAPTECE
jgi:hypothetical protein